MLASVALEEEKETCASMFAFLLCSQWAVVAYDTGRY
jgi:hypothetical protein